MCPESGQRGEARTCESNRLVGFGKTKVRSRFFQDSSVDCSYEKLIQWGKVSGFPPALHRSCLHQHYARPIVHFSRPSILNFERQVHGIKLHDVAISEFAVDDPAAFEESWLDSIKQRRGLIAMKDIERVRRRPSRQQ
jgi:hypothetical protein